MKRPLASLLATTLAAGTVAALAPASPASADTNVCAGTGTAFTSPIFYPVSLTPSGTTANATVLAPNTGSFFFLFTFGGVGACVPDLGKGLTATGTVSGWCGHSSGTGVTGQGHRFAWVEAGSLAVITGEVTGVAQVGPDPFVPGNSCFTGATQFLVNLAFVLSHCAVLKQKNLTAVTIPVPATHLLTPPVFGISAHVTTFPRTQHYWTKVCL